MMAQNAPLIVRLVATSILAANRAGKIVRDVLKKGELGIVEKGKNDLQTEADRAAQSCILASLSKQYPGVTIIGEEGILTGEVPSDWIVSGCDEEVLKLKCPAEYQSVNESDIVVWVDPLDGTNEYTQGLVEHVTVLIGVAVKERAVAGVIHQPFFNFKSENAGRTLWGIIGAGVGGFTPKSPPHGRRVITTTRSHSTPIVQAALDALKPDEILKVGGAGHKVLLLMEGKANAYVFASRGCKRWDTCAPEAVLVAMGGKLTDLHGNLYDYSKNTSHENTGGVLATALKSEHSSYLDNIPNDIKQTL